MCYAANFIMISLPTGYTLRLAKQGDLPEIVYFVYLEYNNRGKLFVLILLVLLLFFSLFKMTVGLLIMLCTLFMCLAFLISVYQAWLNFMQKRILCIYFIEFENKMCGYIRCETHEKYYFILELIVDTRFRSKGLGRSLIMSCIDETEKSIYLTCSSYLKSFYKRFGFVEVDPLNIPSEISWLPMHKAKYLMGFNRNGFDCNI